MSGRPGRLRRGDVLRDSASLQERDGLGRDVDVGPWVARPLKRPRRRAMVTPRATRTKRAMAAPFEATERNASTSAEAPSNTSGHQKWNGTAESLNARPTMIISAASASTMSWLPPSPLRDHSRDVHLDEFCRDRRQVGSAQQAGQQADAVQHDAGGARAVHGVFERGLAGAAAALQDAGHHVRRHARHLHREKDRHQVVGRCHQAHAERRAQQQRVKVLAVLLVGQARHPHQDDEPDGESQQEHAEEHRHRIVNEHAGEDFLPRDRPTTAPIADRRAGHNQNATAEPASAIQNG